MDEDVRQAFEMTWARMEQSAAETREQFGLTRREIGIAFEATRHEVQLVAEGVLAVDQKLDRRTTELEAKIDALSDLPMRVRLLEQQCGLEAHTTPGSAAEDLLNF